MGYRDEMFKDKKGYIFSNNFGNSIFERNGQWTICHGLHEGFKKDADYYDKSGRDYFKKKKYDKAITCFKKAIKLDPKNANVHLNLAYAYRDKELTSSGKLLLIMFTITPDRTKEMINNPRGHVINAPNLENYDKAALHFKKSRELDTSFGESNNPNDTLKDFLFSPSPSMDNELKFTKEPDGFFKEGNPFNSVPAIAILKTSDEKGVD